MAIHESKEKILQHEHELKDSFSMDKFSLKDKVAVISGGNTGLGQGYAIAMAKAGADIFIPTFGKNTRKLIKEEGRKVGFMDCDLTAKGVPHEVINEAVKQMGI